jgi:hypothetical protein
MKGFKEFGEKGCQAAHKEVIHLHHHIVFKPILIKKLSTIKKRCAMESLSFSPKKDRKIKARTYTNRSTQKNYINHNKPASLVAITEAHLITAVINAKKVKPSGQSIYQMHLCK